MCSFGFNLDFNFFSGGEEILPCLKGNVKVFFWPLGRKQPNLAYMTILSKNVKVSLMLFPKNIGQ